MEASKGGGPNLEKVGHRKVGPRRGRVGPRRVGGPKVSRFFFPLPPQFSFFLPSLGGLFVEFWWCFRRPGPEMCTFGVLLAGGRAEGPAEGGPAEDSTDTPHNTHHTTHLTQHTSHLTQHNATQHGLALTLVNKSDLLKPNWPKAVLV